MYLNKFDEVFKVLLIVNCHPIVVIPPHPIVLNLASIAKCMKGSKDQQVGSHVKLHKLVYYTDIHT